MEVGSREDFLSADQGSFMQPAIKRRAAAIVIRSTLFLYAHKL